jgi:hypothetical protein
MTPLLSLQILLPSSNIVPITAPHYAISTIDVTPTSTVHDETTAFFANTTADTSTALLSQPHIM